MEILTRSSLLSIILLALVGLVGWLTYRHWNEGPWDLPGPAKPRPLVTVDAGKPVMKPKLAVSTDVIVSKNLFDPERGAGVTREAEVNSLAFQRIRGMILLGTAIIGNNRFAVLQDPGNVAATPRAPGQTATTTRVKLGDTVEGFRLSEVAERRVVFTKGASRVEVALDYFRKPEEGVQTAPVPRQVGTPTPRAVVPRTIPQLPRRDRLPIPPNPNPDQ